MASIHATRPGAIPSRVETRWEQGADAIEVARNTSPSGVAAVPSKAAIVIPNWNGAALLTPCLESLLGQSQGGHVIVVDNGSSDESLAVLAKYPAAEVIALDRNQGFAGGVNVGFKRAMEHGFEYVAAFNSDAVADRTWLDELVKALDDDPAVGIATCKLLNADGSRIDSTGDCYTTWGLPYPRGRHESDLDRYDRDDEQREVFGASGGASLYRVKMLEQVGLFDESFFAYLEDVDLSFRAQLAGWRVRYAPAAIAYHEISATSSRISGFGTRQFCRNLPRLMLKNVPRRYLFRMSWRFALGYLSFLLWALKAGESRAALNGIGSGIALTFDTVRQRRRIQCERKVSDLYIWDMMTHELPPRAHSLRRVQSVWRKATHRP